MSGEPQDAGSWVAIAGFVVAAVGLLVLLLTLLVLHEQTTQTRNQAFQNVTSQYLELDRLFFENPELKPYFYDGWPVDEGDPKLFAKLYT